MNQSKAIVISKVKRARRILTWAIFTGFLLYSLGPHKSGCCTIINGISKLTYYRKFSLFYM